MPSKIDQILKTQKQILKEVKELKKAAKEELKEESAILADESQEMEELKRLENLEKKLEAEVKVSPLKKITYRDFSKSAVGAFFGILGHFSFFYGVKIAHDISVARATLLYVVAFLIGLTFLYFTGFRQLKESKHMLPVRLLVIYCTSLAMVLVVLVLFDFVSIHHSFTEIYKSVSTISILAVMGAATADLIGRHE